MNKNETIKMFAMIKWLFPRDDTFKKADQQMVDAWQIMLSGIPFDVAAAAVQKHATVSPFPPSLNEILQQAALISNPGLSITATEAWDHVLNAVRKYGRMRKDEAFQNMPDEVADFARNWFIEICNSETLDVIRGQFFKAWDMYQQRKKDDAVLPDYIKQVGEKMKLSDGYDKDFNSIHRIAE